MPELTDVQAIIDVAQEACGPAEITLDGQVVALIDSLRGTLLDVDAIVSSLRPTPRRTHGTVTTRTPQAFAGYLARHALPWSEVWVDDDRHTLLAVLNADSPTEPGWRDHRVILRPAMTVAFDAWTGIDGVPLALDEFGRFLRDRAGDVGSTAADMLAGFSRRQDRLVGKSHGLVEKSHGLVEKCHGLETETGNPEPVRDGPGTDPSDATATTPGPTNVSDLGLPATFLIEMSPYAEGQTRLVNARLIYRHDDEHPRITVHLDGAAAALDDAFDEIVATADQLIAPPVWEGTPALPAT